jgi:hypothetical protein
VCEHHVRGGQQYVGWFGDTNQETDRTRCRPDYHMRRSWRWSKGRRQVWCGGRVGQGISRSC